MPISRSPLGMNARNFVYLDPNNSAEAKRLADDKLLTKQLLLNNGISTSELYHSFERRSDIADYDWDLPERGFVIKPSRGYGGEGIIAIKQFKNGIATTVSGQRLTIDQLMSHLYDILEGGYSLQFLPDKAIIEERLVPHPFFKKLSAVGIPDIRIVVYDHIPVMGMMRLPTLASGGKANIHQGALGFGIDMRTGITIGAIIGKRKEVAFIPGSKVKTHGLRIPLWDSILQLAAETQAISGLGYAGVDIVLTNKGVPAVLEINARPGLSIQNANRDSLRTRLERIDKIPTPSPERGVEMAKSLFVSPFAEKVKITKPTVPLVIPVQLHNGDISTQALAKVNTGNIRTSIDISLAQQLSLLDSEKRIIVKTPLGKKERTVVLCKITIADRLLSTSVIVSDRSNFKHKISLGRNDLKHVKIDPHLKQVIHKAETLVEI